MDKDYEINEGTLAIISLENGNSKILEDRNDYIIQKSSFDILDYSCKYFGSSYEGRKEGAKAIIGANYKIPIIIEDARNIIFFPTTSPDDNQCIWIAVNRIEKYSEEKFNSTKIIFDNGVELLLPFSYRAIENQIYRATRLSYLLKNRKK